MKLLKFVKKHFHLFILLILIFISTWPFFHQGLIPTHDGEYHVMRFYEFDKAIRDGSFYPRWAMDFNNGFGIPLFNYVYPLPNYVSFLLHAVGSSFIDSFRISMILATLLAGAFFYKWMRVFFEKMPALIGAVFYLFAPYRFVDMYVRGSIGEIWAMTFFPGFLWVVTCFMETKKKKYFFMSVFFLTLIIFSHNILALMFFGFALAYVVVLIKSYSLSKSDILSLSYIFIFALGLSSVFWLPALIERSLVQGLEIYSATKNFPEIFQLIFPSWGTGFSDSQFDNQMSFQIGVANLLVVVGSLFFLYRFREHKGLVVFFLISFFAVFFLMISYSQFLWSNIPLISYVQFPWRFLSLEVLICAFLASFTASKLPRLIGIFFIALVIWMGIGYIKPAYYLERPDSYYLTRSNFIDGTNSPGNVFNTAWMTYEQNVSNEKVQGALPIEYKVLVWKTNHRRIVLNSRLAQKITLGVAYFPGWRVFVDEKQVKSEYNKKGLLVIDLPSGNHVVDIVLKSTRIQSVSGLLSLVSFFVLLVYSFRKNKS